MEHLHTASLLKDEQASIIFKSIYGYLNDGIVPQFEDSGSQIYWDFLISSIERFAESYNKKVEAGRAKLNEINAERAAKKKTESLPSATTEIKTDLDKLIQRIKDSNCETWKEHYNDCRENTRLWDSCFEQHLIDGGDIEGFYKRHKTEG